MLNLIDKISDKYFDEIINRRGENSLKWARGANELPLFWGGADMDFRITPKIIHAISKKSARDFWIY